MHYTNRFVFEEIALQSQQNVANNLLQGRVTLRNLSSTFILKLFDSDLLRLKLGMDLKAWFP